MCVFLNTDSAVHSVSGFSAAVAELWGILDGLLLQKQGRDKVFTQSNNIENVISICEKTNRAADALAKMTLLSDESLYMFEDFPLEIKEILKDDSSFDNFSMIYSM
ncbi:hypothetical protein Gotur_006841 [Gossypium turneri]